MRKALAALAIVGTLFLVGCSSASVAGVTTVDTGTFVAKIAEPGVTIVDVRRPDEFAAGHVDGAININLQSGTFESDIAQLDPNATYAVYCRSGNRSSEATAIMGEAGFTDVTNLGGAGFPDLASAGVPVATGS